MGLFSFARNLAPSLLGVSLVFKGQMAGFGRSGRGKRDRLYYARLIKTLPGAALNQVADEAAGLVVVAPRVPAPVREQRAADLRAFACVHHLFSAVAVARRDGIAPVRRWRYPRKGQFVPGEACAARQCSTSSVHWGRGGMAASPCVWVCLRPVRRGRRRAFGRASTLGCCPQGPLSRCSAGLASPWCACPAACAPPSGPGRHPPLDAAPRPGGLARCRRVRRFPQGGLGGQVCARDRPRPRGGSRERCVSSALLRPRFGTASPSQHFVGLVVA